MKKPNFVIRRRSFITKFENINNVYDFDEKPIGKGSFGVVKRATHKMTKQIRAVKLILKSQIADLNKFKVEIDILRTLDHPNVVKLYEWYEDDKYFYLVMEYCNGGELFDRIQEIGQFAEKDAKIIFKQVMTAIRYCHNNKIVHRDLKPENFVFENKDKNSTLKLIDFGLSKLYEDPKSGVTVHLKTKVGSPYYIAPEVFTGNYNHLCDIWSCGVILYIILSGYPPFAGENDKEVLQNVELGKFNFNDEEWKCVSKQAKDLICRMLCKPNLRPSAEQILNDLWLLSLANPKTENPKLMIMDNMRKFRNSSKLQKVLLTYMATQITDSEVTKLKNTFFEIDINKDGKISFDELCTGLGDQYSVSELKEIMASIDIDHNGFIDYTEFLASSMEENIFLQENMLLNTFNTFDLDKSGKISAQELKKIAGCELGECDEIIWMTMIEEADLDKDGEIDFNEFMKLMYGYSMPKHPSQT